MFRSTLRYLMMAMMIAAVAPLISSAADARIGGGSSFGSRGGRTFNSVPSTPTAPNTTAPITRSTTQPNAGATTPGGFGAPARQGSGFGRLLVGGLLGAGLFGLLSGGGLFGGLSGFASILGLLMQVALIGGVGWLIWSFFKNRSTFSGMATGSANAGFGGPGTHAQSVNRDGYNGGYSQGGFGGGGGFGGNAGGASGQPLQIQQSDYEAFERILSEFQIAYGKGDFNRLAEFATPEMLAYLSEDLKENSRKGVRNEISNVKFLKGDLAEAWTEREEDYATVSMQYSIVDAMVEISSGRVVEGDLQRPQDVTEVWTFVRNHRDLARGWMVSAIQQVEG